MKFNSNIYSFFSFSTNSIETFIQFSFFIGVRKKKKKKNASFVGLAIPNKWLEKHGTKLEWVGGYTQHNLLNQSHTLFTCIVPAKLLSTAPLSIFV